MHRDPQALIAATPEPRTRASLARDLRALGVGSGMALIVHSSLSSLGWVNGGTVAVVQALMDALTPEGTLVMPTHSGALSEPSLWVAPPIPSEWHDTVRDTMPAYDPRITPCREVGQVPETFRTFPDVLRSAHPMVSFAAWGKHAERVTADHEYAYEMGEGSPLARLYEMDAYVLLLGVGFRRNTSFHLAEYRIPHRVVIEKGSPVMENGQRVWKTYPDIEFRDHDFPLIGEEFRRTGKVVTAPVGSASADLFRQRDCVDFAVQWFGDRR